MVLTFNATLELGKPYDGRLTIKNVILYNTLILYNHFVDIETIDALIYAITLLMILSLISFNHIESVGLYQRPVNRSTA